MWTVLIQNVSDTDWWITTAALLNTIFNKMQIDMKVTLPIPQLKWITFSELFQSIVADNVDLPAV